MGKSTRKGENVRPLVAILCAPDLEPHDDPARVVGRRTRYVGDELRFLRGHEVVVVAVLKDALRAREHGYLRTEDEVRLAGGVSAGDRIEVAPVMPDGGLSFVTSDPRAVDLECWMHLANDGTAAKTKGEQA
jgi:hypothetical protein